jgi:hypothetical protein
MVNLRNYAYSTGGPDYVLGTGPRSMSFMIVQIVVYGVKAATNGIRWVCDDPNIGRILNAVASREQAMKEPGFSPFIAPVMAQLAIAYFPGSQIVSCIPEEADHDPLPLGMNAKTSRL